jgi:RimJ/RimL family protein N-acetyltransferase
MRTSKRAKLAEATAVVDNPASWTLLDRLGFLKKLRDAGGFQKHGLTCDLFKYSLELGE